MQDRFNCTTAQCGLSIQVIRDYIHMEEHDYRYLDAIVEYTYTQVNPAYALVFLQVDNLRVVPTSLRQESLQ